MFDSGVSASTRELSVYYSTLEGEKIIWEGGVSRQEEVFLSIAATRSVSLRSGFVVVVVVGGERIGRPIGGFKEGGM